MHSALHYRGEAYAPVHGATYAYVENGLQTLIFMLSEPLDQASQQQYLGLERFSGEIRFSIRPHTNSQIKLLPNRVSRLLDEPPGLSHAFSQFLRSHLKLGSAGRALRPPHFSPIRQTFIRGDC